MNLRDNLAKFFYDCGKLTFAMLVIGGFTRIPFRLGDQILGFAFTLILVVVGIIIDSWILTKEESL
jgi:hypothetical protein